MHAERQTTDLSVKHSFTLYPSLSPYRITDRETNTLAARGLEELRINLLLSSCAVVSVFGSGGK
jgi:hypothetical protein